jgi:hypothetical protein
MSKLQDIAPEVQGLVRAWRVRPNGLMVPVAEVQNQLQYTWGFIAAQSLGLGDVKYQIDAMYIEFENVAAPANPVTVPTYDRSEGLEYYDDLSASGTKDYIRASLASNPALGVKTGYESHFGAGEGNQLTFFAQTSGAIGVHGKTFSDSVNSKVYGAALIATPVFADPTQDVIFARTYFSVSEQVVKEASSQIGITWEISFL